MSPWAPKPACSVCRRTHCDDPTHTKEYREKLREKERRLRRPYISEERRGREQCVRDWVEQHGWICQGFGCPSHATQQLEADHIDPVSMGGDPLGELQALCHQCNVRRYAAMKRAGEGAQ